MLSGLRPIAALYGMPLLTLSLIALYAYFGITLSVTDRVRPILISEIAVMAASILMIAMTINQPKPRRSNAINLFCLLLNLTFGVGALLIGAGAVPIGP